MLKAKYEYFKKNKGSKISVNEALTPLQEKENYEKGFKKKRIKLREQGMIEKLMIIT